MKYKTCKDCCESKATEYFYKKASAKDGHMNICKYCSGERTKKYRRNPDVQKRLFQIRRKSQLKKKFGITPEEYDKMFFSQSGVCLICRKPEKQSKALAVDHCHITGRVRGLLCSLCNTAIGKLDDNPKLLIRAAEYLLAHGGNN